MINLLYIAALLAAIAFAVLVIYLAFTLKAAQRTLTNVADTLEGLEKQMEGITVETTALLNKTNKLAEDMNEKSQKVNTLVEGVQNIGNSVKDFNQSIRLVSTRVSTLAEKNTDKAAEAVKWGTVLIDLWNRRKKEAKTEVEIKEELK